MKKLLATLLASAALLVATLTTPLASANPSSGNQSYTWQWGSICTGLGKHLPGYGGALGVTTTPSTLYGPQCWSTYTSVWNTAGQGSEGTAGNPNSSAYVPGTPNQSRHVGCVGVFQCGIYFYRHN